jgi:uncharacterized protein YndB with AHSA1/START domain
MLLTNRIQIRAPRADVWAFLANPDEFPNWNPRILEVRRRRQGQLELGEGFEVSLLMGPRPAYFAVDVTRCVPLKRLRLQHRHVEDPDDVCVVEAYCLRERGDVTEVIQRVDLRNESVAAWTRLVYWAIHRWGDVVEGPQLRRLKELLEAAEPVEGA